MLLSLAQWQKLTFAKFHILFPSRKLVTKITKKVLAKTNLVKVFKTTSSFYKQSKIWTIAPKISPANIRLDEDVLKTSWRRLSSLFSRRLDKDEYIHINHTSSEDVLVKTNIFVLSIRLQNVFKTCRKYVLKTFSRRFEDVSPK